MKRTIFYTAVFALFLTFSCEYDKVLLVSKPVTDPNDNPGCPCDTTGYRDCDCDMLDPDRCLCDTTRYHDCDCDTMDPERCLCDTSGYRDCDCDREDPYPFLCPCDTSVWRDCECDYIDPYKNPCPCDTTKYRDCDCDIYDPKKCPCDSTPYRDCDCDILDPESCPCDVTPYHDCDCDFLQPELCLCDTSKYKDPGCYCDEDTAQRPKPPTSTVKYSQHIQPIWNKYCTVCHDETSTTNVNLLPGYSWNSLQNYIIPGNPDVSRLIEFISGPVPYMPQNPPFLTEEEVNLVRQWIKEGAKND